MILCELKLYLLIGLFLSVGSKSPHSQATLSVPMKSKEGGGGGGGGGGGLVPQHGCVTIIMKKSVMSQLELHQGADFLRQQYRSVEDYTDGEI